MEKAFDLVSKALSDTSDRIVRAFDDAIAKVEAIDVSVDDEPCELCGGEGWYVSANMPDGDDVECPHCAPEADYERADHENDTDRDAA